MSAVFAASEHEIALAERGTRKSLGAYYTPGDVADGLVSVALGPLLRERTALGAEAVAAVRVLDPACGSGRMLLAAGRAVAAALEQTGLGWEDARRIAFGECLVGVDVDPDALAICRGALAAAAGIGPDALTARLLKADALTLPAESGRVGDGGGGGDGGDGRDGPSERADVDGPRSWAELAEWVGASAGFDAVLGNPPFRNQLGSATARRRGETRMLRDRFGPAVAGYTDPAAVFLLLAHEVARPDGGVVALIEPMSLLASRDAGGVRRRLTEDADLAGLWFAGEQIFDAQVAVCAPVIVRRAEGAAVPSTEREAAPGPGDVAPSTRIWSGRSFDPAGQARMPTPDDDTWSGPLATLHGVPDVELTSHGTIGDMAAATADFRQHFYGVAEALVDVAEAPNGDDERWPALVTTGLVDPARCGWGERPTTVARTRYRHPRVDRSALDAPMADWAAARLVPKVLVATQTKVPEAVADPTGRWLPAVPVISVVPHEATAVWAIAAAICSPPLAATAARRHMGSARNGAGLRLRAADLLALPLPGDGTRWTEAAAFFRAASEAVDPVEARRLLVESAAAMCAAYGIDDSDLLIAWWRSLLPKPRR